MLYTGIVIISVISAIFAKKNGIVLERNVVLLVVLIEGLGIGIGAYDFYHNEIGFAGNLERPEAGKAEEKEILFAEAGERDEEWEITVSPRQLEAEEIESRLDMAQKEIDSTVFVRNRSANEVTEALVLQDVYAGGLVKADWDFSEPMLVSTDGTLMYENLEKETPVTVYATAMLSCGGEERAYTFPFSVKMPDASSATGFTYYMKRALEKADIREPTAEKMVLPDKVAEQPVHWSRPRDNRGVWFSAMGLLAGVGIVLGKREEEKRLQRQRQKELSADYPEIVSALSLYVSAGITVRSAFVRIFSVYVDRQKRRGIRDRPGYAAIGSMVRQMEDGIGEGQAYHTLGDLTNHKDYRKLAMMLTKNVRHGTVKLAEQLEKEEAQAFEARKIAARILGEEVSTKLLAPMLMLLAVVLVILVAPALCNLQMS